MLTLLYSGNIGMGQDLHTLVRAVARANGDMNFRTLIVGSGKGLASVKRLARDLQVRNVEFRDPVPLYKLNDLLASGDVHVICQKPGTEGLLVPSKIYGTLSVGRPSLFIGPEDCEVSRIIRESHSGYIVRPEDVNAAFSALINLVLSSALRKKMGENAREYYRQHFGRNRSVGKIIALIDQVS